MTLEGLKETSFFSYVWFLENVRESAKENKMKSKYSKEIKFKFKLNWMYYFYVLHIYSNPF